MSDRTLWYAPGVKSAWYGSLWSALWHYRKAKDRTLSTPEEANLISSLTTAGTHRPILDLDFPHRYVPSSTPGHGHLYLDIDLPRWRWTILMLGLRIGGVIEYGFMVWSIRRGANFVRREGLIKKPFEYSLQPEAEPVFVKRNIDKQQPF